MSLATLAADPDRCSLGFHLSQHPQWCSCSEMGEWSIFLAALKAARRSDGLIHQTDVRPRIRGRIEAKHIGTLYRRAVAEHLIAVDGWEDGTDTAGRNTDKPQRRYVWRGP